MTGKKTLNVFMDSRKWLWTLLLVNVTGFLFGIWYYLPQLSQSNPLLWLFIIDCPLYVLLFAAICGLRLKGNDLDQRSKSNAPSVPGWLYYLTSVGLVKYGFWTGLVVFLYWNVLFSAAPVLYSILFPLHIGMMLEGIILIPRTGKIQEGAWKRKLLEPLLVCVWFLLNDWLDYFMGTVTAVPPAHLGLLMWESLAATLILTIGIFLSRRA